MAAMRQANRRGLDPHEVEALDAAMAEYGRAKETAAAAWKAAHAAYTATLVEARQERDDRILAVIDEGSRSTTSRVAEHIKMTLAAISDMRRRRAARRAAQTAQAA